MSEILRANGAQDWRVASFVTYLYTVDCGITQLQNSEKVMLLN